MIPVNKRTIVMLFISFLYSVKLVAQTNEAPEKLNLPGDNLNLAAVLDVFQRSPTLEEFEAVLNADTSKINNLDLNNDDQIDYIKVLDKQEGTLHSIILQVDVNATESQDVAVIFVEKNGDDVKIQLVGDEDLYGKDYILEPASDRRSAATENPGYKGDGTTVIHTTNNYYYNTENNNYASRPDYCPPPSSWIIIGFIYGPVYSPWVSPWHWGYYPGWWSPWRPYYWDVYYGHWYYHHHWHGWWYWRAPYHHFDRYYAGYRTNRRHSGVVMNYRAQGVYRKTYENPNPAPRPDRKANFPSHAIATDRNPVIVKPAGIAKPSVSPAKDQMQKPGVKPAQPVKGSVKPSTPSKEKQTVKPTTPSGKPTDVKPSTPPSKDKPDVKPATPSKVQPSVKPSITPRKPTGGRTVAPTKPAAPMKEAEKK